MTKTYYKSTRGPSEIVSSESMLRGIAGDGGLYVPTEIPQLDRPLTELMTMTYKELALYILKMYLTDFTRDELKVCVEKAYDDKFDTPTIAPVVKKAGAYFLELYHGPTLAFKDMALSILPHLLKKATEKLSITEKILILTATSGDTGKAALEGFTDVEGIKIIVFYPQNGVSAIQERQMITQKGSNTYVIAIKGNFDDAQRGVKEIFNDEEFNRLLKREGYMFSSANSINVGRLIPQIIYYFYSYGQLLKGGEIKANEKINLVVPTGNFGNILAAFYAKGMGLPVHKLICASNENHVLHDFFQEGIYDKRRDLITTSSPSMDILVSSNLERLLYEVSGHDPSKILDLMTRLERDGIYHLPPDMKGKLHDFYGNFAIEEETSKAIRKVYQEHNYVIDPHTAVAYTVYEKYKKDTSDDTKTIIVSTASPFKFTRSVLEAIQDKEALKNDFELIKTLSEATGLEIPKAISNIEQREINHKRTCSTDEMRAVIENIVNG